MKPQNQSVLTTTQLIIGLILALIIGAGITFFIILPAETGRDPGGLGAKTGLDQLSGDSETTAETPAANVTLLTGTLYVAVDPATAEPVVDDFGRSEPAMDGINIRAHDQAYKTETVDINLEAGGQVEYKAIMEEGEALLYSWEADGILYYDFHAHQAEGNPDFWTRYAEGESNSHHGSIIAPYSGQHGWFWLNTEDKAVTVKLTVAGYYNELVRIEIGEEAEY